jgi:putative flippase GtrA
MMASVILAMTRTVSKTGFRARLARHQTLVRYGLIGGAAAIIDLGLFFVLFTLAGSSELLAHTVSVASAVVFSFTLNARHNFKTTDHTALRFMSFVLACFIGFLAGYGIILTVAGGFEDAVLGGNIGKLVSLPVVFVLQYILNSRITFRQGRAP